MDKTLAALLFPIILSIILPTISVYSCIPTGGAIGAIYYGKLRLDSVLKSLRDMGLKAVISEENVNGLTLKRVEVKLGDLAYKEGALYGYVYKGSNKSLVMAETDKELSDSSLKLMELLLISAGQANLSRFSKPIASYDNVLPPTALVKWLEDEGKIEVKQEVLRCSSGGLRIQLKNKEVAVISNGIDRDLSFGIISRALESIGLHAIWLNATDPKSLAKVLNYAAAIVLGGPLSPRSGFVSDVYMPKEEARKLLIRLREGKRGGIIANGELPGGRPLIVIAGVDRYDTADTASAFVSSNRPLKIKERVEFLSAGEGNGSFELKVKSSASCGYVGVEGIRQGISVNAGYGYIIVLLGESAPNPCYRHVVQWYKLDLDKRVLKITVGLKRSAEVCIQCLAGVSTEIRAGPLPPGEWTLVINGIESKVKLDP